MINGTFAGGPTTRSALPSMRLAWAIPIAWSLRAFALATRRLREGTNFSWLSTARLTAA